MPLSRGKLSPLSCLPIIPQHTVRLTTANRNRAEKLAERLLEDEPRLDNTAAFGPGVAPGLGPWPALVIEDHSAITLFETEGNLAYSYRALLLAGTGDQVVIGVPRSRAFEDYCAGTLGLGRPEVICLARKDGGEPLAKQAASDEALIAKAAGRARSAGGFNVIAYMGSGDVWRLAARISAMAERPVRVAAPPPLLTRRVNDKLWFAERVRELLGPRALPATTAAHGLASLVGQIKAMSRKHDSIAIKLRRSASSAGNLVLNLDQIRTMPSLSLHGWLGERLQRLGWTGNFPILVTAWEHPVFASPSVQLWLPKSGQGMPVVEGVFDQVTSGKTAVFVGAEPTHVSVEWQRRIVEEAASIGVLFQRLGYFGRCSLDSILVGRCYDSATLHWVECNGRWGGVSIPMTLANRLLGNWRQAWPVIAEGYATAAPARDLRAVLAELSDELYDCRTRPHGAIILSPGRLEAAQGFELLVLASTPAAARAQAARVASKLAGNAA